jgi:hypothetical protein
MTAAAARYAAVVPTPIRESRRRRRQEQPAHVVGDDMAERAGRRTAATPR